jgi:hypothetical protein
VSRGLVGAAWCIWSLLLTLRPVGRPAGLCTTTLEAGRTITALVRVQGVRRKTQTVKGTNVLNEFRASGTMNHLRASLVVSEAIARRHDPGAIDN